MANIKITGLKDLKRQLRKDLREKMNEAAEESIADATLQTWEVAQENVGVLSGRLKHKGLKKSVRKRTGRIYITKSFNYAQYPEFGTSEQPAQGFMRKAAEFARHGFRNVTAKRVTKKLGA